MAWPDLDREPMRAGARGGGHRRDRLGVHRPAPARAGLRGCARSTTSARRRSRSTRRTSSTTASAARPAATFQVRPGEGGAGLPRGGRVAGGALRRRARARARGPAGRGARGSKRARLCELLERTAAFYVKYLWEADAGGEGADVSGRARAGARRCCGASASGIAPNGWDTVLLRRPARGLQVEELRGGRADAARQKGGGTTTASARGSCSRSAIERGRVLGFGARAMRPDAEGRST